MRTKPRKPLRWIAPDALEREYVSLLRSMARDIEKLVRLNIYPVLDLAVDAVEDEPYSAGWYESLRLGFLTVAQQVNTVPYEQRMGDLMKRMATFNKKQFHKIFRAAYGVDVFVSEPWLPNVLRVWEAQNIKLIRSIPTQELDKLSGRIVAAVRAGRPPRSTISELTAEFGVTRSRAELIARDQTGKLNGQLTKERQSKIGVTSYTWRGVLDSRERATHVAREGQTFEWNNPPEDGHPGEPVQCFPGSTKIHGFPLLNKLYRRWYSGELTEVVLDDGIVLCATPNHPILTDYGFETIQSIDVGQYVIGAGGESGGVVEVDGEKLIPTFEQIFNTVSGFSLTGAITTYGASGQFHGDGSNGEVDVISTDSLLVNKINFSVYENILKLGLTRTDMILAHGSLSSNSTLFKGFFGRGILSSNVSRAKLIVSLLLRHLRPFEFFSFASSARHNACLIETNADNATSNSEDFRNSVFALACLIHGDKALDVQADSIMRGMTGVFTGVYANSREVLSNRIPVEADGFGDGDYGQSRIMQARSVIEVRTRKFAGHVYNLQSISGYYTANGVQVSNCRCYAEPVLPLLDDMPALTVFKEAA